MCTPMFPQGDQYFSDISDIFTTDSDEKSISERVQKFLSENELFLPVSPEFPYDYISLMDFPSTEEETSSFSSWSPLVQSPTPFLLENRTVQRTQEGKEPKALESQLKIQTRRLKLPGFSQNSSARSKAKKIALEATYAKLSQENKKFKDALIVAEAENRVLKEQLAQIRQLSARIPIRQADAFTATALTKEPQFKTTDLEADLLQYACSEDLKRSPLNGLS